MIGSEKAYPHPPAWPHSADLERGTDEKPPRQVPRSPAYVQQEADEHYDRCSRVPPDRGAAFSHPGPRDERPESTVKYLVALVLGLAVILFMCRQASADFTQNLSSDATEAHASLQQAMLVQVLHHNLKCKEAEDRQQERRHSRSKLDSARLHEVQMQYGNNSHELLKLQIIGHQASMQLTQQHNHEQEVFMHEESKQAMDGMIKMGTSSLMAQESMTARSVDSAQAMLDATMETVKVISTQK